LKVYLETNGTQPEALHSVVSEIDFLSMDFKLPSSTGGKEFWKQHLEFLEVAASETDHLQVFVKAVVSQETPLSELETAAKLIKQVSSEIPLILQPVTHHENGPEPPDSTRLLALQTFAAKFLPNIRVIPQCHPILGAL
jgi:organic radical activating enzyme